MGWCFILYRYDGLGGVSYNIGMTDGVVLHNIYTTPSVIPILYEA